MKVSRIDIWGVAICRALTHCSVSDATDRKVVRGGVEEVGLKFELIKLGAESTILANCLENQDEY
jgi:hypothetical protein